LIWTEAFLDAEAAVATVAGSATSAANSVIARNRLGIGYPDEPIGLMAEVQIPRIRGGRRVYL
jgi:hypothetical protein